MKILIASDHAGYDLKESVKQHFSQYQWEDLGTHSAERCDYPDFAHALGQAVAADSQAVAVLICGSGNGVAMTANKHENVRAALCWNQEIAALARQHNNANVVCLPARFIPENEAFAIVEIFLNTPFEGGRHTQRVNKINLPHL